jgi:caffeoyl-CoA O-methyltransferase
MDIVAPEINDYLLAHSEPADDVLRDLAEQTQRELGGRAVMQISHDEGELLTMLVRLTGARRAVEVGTFTGYSSICIARGLPDDGHLLCCDVSEEWTAIARDYWDRAGVADKISLEIGPATETLRALPAEESLDFAFIDADKVGYPDYYEECLRLLRSNGVIMLDNTLREGTVIDPPEGDEGTAVMARLNDRIAADDRVDVAMLGIADGVTLVRKR